MNNAQRGYLRDREVVALVRRLGAVNTDQVRALMFRFPTGLRKAQERLSVLVERGELNRCRIAPNEPYVYYIGRRPAQLEHKVMISWAYAHIVTNLASWECLEEWRQEDVCGELRCDAVAGIHIKPTGEWRFVFVEADGGDNSFDKVSLYNRLYESQAYLGSWWAERASRFPSILVVTHSEGRKRTVLERIRRENVNNLRWEVVTVGEVEEHVSGRDAGAGDTRRTRRLSGGVPAQGVRA
jgi:hypothetical protein